MANYIIPTLNDGLEIKNPVIVEVTVGFTSAMADAKVLNLTVSLETLSTKFGVLLDAISVDSMDYNREGLFALAQYELDLRHKV